MTDGVRRLEKHSVFRGKVSCIILATMIRHLPFSYGKQRYGEQRILTPRLCRLSFHRKYRNGLQDNRTVVSCRYESEDS